MSATYPVLLDHCQTAEPDLICYDSTNWPARPVAHALGVQAVRTVPHTASNAHYNLMGPDEEWSPRRDDLPLLFVSLGSIMSDGAWQVAMTAEDVESTGDIEVRPWFPQPAVFKHAKAFISHGGMNSTMEAVHQGVPLVVVPQTPEQAANADRVTELGLGERADDHAGLRAAVERVAASGTIRRNLDRMRAAIAHGGGAAKAAEIILSRAPRAA